LCLLIAAANYDGPLAAHSPRSRLPVSHVRHITASAEKLHDLHAGACHLCPTGFRIGVLFKPTNCVPVEHEVDFPQMALGSQADRVTPCAKLDHGGVLDEGLPLSKAGVQG
jgi:hypothetical protein